MDLSEAGKRSKRQRQGLIAALMHEEALEILEDGLGWETVEAQLILLAKRAAAKVYPNPERLVR